MTDRGLAEYLRENGYPEHICRAGASGLLARWKEFVDEVQHGYKLGLEDYRNDLDLRAVIALAGLESQAQRTTNGCAASLLPSTSASGKALPEIRSGISVIPATRPEICWQT